MLAAIDLTCLSAVTQVKCIIFIALGFQFEDLVFLECYVNIIILQGRSQEGGWGGVQANHAPSTDFSLTLPIRDKVASHSDKVGQG